MIIFLGKNLKLVLILSIWLNVVMLLVNIWLLEGGVEIGNGNGFKVSCV